MSNYDAETVFGDVGPITFAILYTVVIVLDRGYIGWTPWGAGPEPLPDPVTTVIVVIAGAVAGILTLALHLELDRILVSLVVVAAPVYLSLTVVAHFVLGAEAVRTVLDLASLAHFWTIVGGPAVLSSAPGSEPSPDT